MFIYLKVCNLYYHYNFLFLAIKKKKISLIKYIYFSVKLKHFQKFEDTTEALASAASLIEGKLCKSLKKVICYFNINVES